MIIGNVTRDPEVRTTPSGQSVVSLGVATNLVWTDASGQKQKKAEFHNVVAWRKLAEIVGQYVKKGSKVYVEGRLETRSWDDQNAIKRSRTEIIADNIIMLDRAGSVNKTTSTPPTEAAASQPAAAAGQPVAQPMAEEEISVEDIPF